MHCSSPLAPSIVNPWSFWGGIETEKSWVTVETHNPHKQEMSQWPKQKKHASNQTVLQFKAQA